MYAHAPLVGSSFPLYFHTILPKNDSHLDVATKYAEGYTDTYVPVVQDQVLVRGSLKYITWHYRPIVIEKV